MKVPPFRFKQFEVAHDKCALKVNTDGVLLGAWADVNGANRILDIGTGTGVIALMMAQRNNHAVIDAIDIDEQAWLQATENFVNSPWPGRLHSVHTALQRFTFVQRHEGDKQIETEVTPGYDLIIVNPPYFVADFKSGNAQKDIARHNITLSYHDLAEGIARLLAPLGNACIVLPLFNLPLLQNLMAGYGLFVTRICEVTAVAGKPAYLALIQLQRGEEELIKSSLCIQNEYGDFTDEYRQLTKAFYLKF